MKITINPVFEWSDAEQKYLLVSHDGVYEVEHVPILFDRDIKNQANQERKTSDTLAGGLGSEASGISGQIIPGLEREAANPTGFGAQDVNNMLVAGGEAVGGANAGITGEANLEAARTRNAGGFANALDEAARIKSRQLSRNALDVSNANALQKQKQQMFAQGELRDIMQSDRANQLRAMGMSEEAIANELKAGQQGWVQNTLNTIKTLTGGAADARYALKGG